MAQCDCGNLTGRVKVHLETPDGRPLDKSYTTCPACRPGEFAEQAFAPLDRLVTGPEAFPHLYVKGADDVYRPKDELMQDTADMIQQDGPTAQRIAQKRATRRTAPMTEAEVERACRRALDHAIN